MHAGEILKFDSEWFGLRIGRYDVDPVAGATWGAGLGLDCLYCLVPVDEIWRVKAATREHDYRLVDVRVEFTAEARSVERPKVVRYAIADDQPWIERIARTAFKTRFHNDDHFDSQLVSDMYANWIKEAFDRGDTIFATGVRGFVTMTKEGVIGLIAVDDSARAKGRGKALMTAALNHAYISGIQRVVVVTQSGNLGAQRAFQHCGFRSTGTGLWLHKWYE